MTEKATQNNELAIHEVDHIVGHVIGACVNRVEIANRHLPIVLCEDLGAIGGDKSQLDFNVAFAVFSASQRWPVPLLDGPVSEGDTVVFRDTVEASEAGKKQPLLAVTVCPSFSRWWVQVKGSEHIVGSIEDDHRIATLDVKSLQTALKPIVTFLTNLLAQQSLKKAVKALSEVPLPSDLPTLEARKISDRDLAALKAAVTLADLKAEGHA